MASNSGINTSKPIAVAQGGTGLATLTNHSVLVGAGTSAITQVAVGTNGQALLGSTGADPAFATLTSTGGSISYTTGPAALNIDIANYVSTTFIPVLTFGGGSTGITYTTQTGLYTRIGNLVFVDIDIALSNKGSSIGDAIVTGLPVTSSATPSVFASRQTSVIYATGEVVFSTIASTTTIAIENQATASAIVPLTDTAFGNTSTFRITGVYFV